MNRRTGILAALGVVLLLVLFYLFLFKPQSDELALIEEDIDAAIAQQATLEARIAELESVRAEAPEIEAALAAAESIIPRDSALPSALRQLQLAADDSGVELVSISPGRPTAVGTEVPELASISLSLSVQGGYYQIVDFLRRVEDPRITARGIVFTAVSVSPGEYPVLSVALNGEMYALLPTPAPEPTETATEEDADVAVDADVDVDVTEEDAA